MIQVHLCSYFMFAELLKSIAYCFLPNLVNFLPFYTHTHTHTHTIMHSFLSFWNSSEVNVSPYVLFTDAWGSVHFWQGANLFFSSVVQLRLYPSICPQVHDSSVTFCCKVFFCVVIFSVLNKKKTPLLPYLFKERYYLLAFFSFTLVTGLEMLIIFFP